MRARYLIGILLVIACNRAAEPAGPSATTGPGAPVQSASADPRTTAPSAAKAECAEDADCEVLTIETTGPHACCPSCRTTAGTRAWAAEIKARCADAPSSNCYPLACPMGPTRPHCDAGRCVAIP
ncbi:MAG TPA: hypothetical protein VE093_37795 [Polyangiaceae bacterium]|nr:hypothetical protein [Polyangiaceae bacterium]